METLDIQIEWDEDGCWLVLRGDGPINFRVHVQDPEQLYDRVKGAIGPWLRERDIAAASFPASAVMQFSDALEEARPLIDPKHPDHHSVHADIWDAREGK